MKRNKSNLILFHYDQDSSFRNLGVLCMNLLNLQNNDKAVFSIKEKQIPRQFILIQFACMMQMLSFITSAGALKKELSCENKPLPAVTPDNYAFVMDNKVVYIASKAISR